jgi:hypothetical protein
MGDRPYLNSSQLCSLVGADSTGNENYAINATPQGALLVETRPYLPPTFVVQASSVVIGNNKSMISLINSNTNIVKVLSIRIVNNQNSALTGVFTDFRFRRITGATGGTALTIQPMDTSDTATSVAAAIGATVSGETSVDLARRCVSSDEWGPGTTDVESNAQANAQIGFMWETPNNSKPIYLRTGQGLTIKCVTNSTQGNFDIEVLFTLETY